MRPVRTGQTYVCLPCLLRIDATTRSTLAIRRRQDVTIKQESICSLATLPLRIAERKPRHNARCSIFSTTSNQRSNSSDAAESNVPIAGDAVVLNQLQLSTLGRLHNFQQQLKKAPESKENPAGVSIDTVLTAIKPHIYDTDKEFVELLGRTYAGQPLKNVQDEISLVSKHRRPSLKTIEDKNTIQILNKLGVIKIKEPKKREAKVSKVDETNTTKKIKQARKEAKKSKKLKIIKGPTRLARRVPSGSIITKTLSKPFIEARSRVSTTSGIRRKPLSAGEGQQTILLAPPNAKSLDGSLIAQSPIEPEATLPVPKLSFDLSRVLFNPGVYQLQDPRSRVYNFDPYLERIMPVTEFNFEALNPYITSSQDDHLRNVSLKYQKRYIGSSSSMSGVMSHFHFLLSAWRPLDMSMLSHRISTSQKFTKITKAPTGIFLRWRDGVYAIDADKEHDSPNILMMQGKSMEKLLTLEKEEFEKYRKPKAGEEAPAIDTDPESYHYSGCGDFLLRSQLDAWDPRLPGTGMFDLKTRACAGIRMDMSNHEQGSGYQIKELSGEWESYDREYHDMMRSAFLKYSLQVRMGRMDGIFVAYHNIERIFGFQYISIAELDAGLHGQTDPCVGDREFKMTVKLMNEIFDLATKQYPEQSLRFVFETREPSKTYPNGIMQIFAEPMSESKIDEIQKAGKTKMDTYEKQMAQGSPVANGENMGGQTIQHKLSPSTLESNSADTAFLEEILGQQSEELAEEPAAIEKTELGPVAGWTVNIYNEVNGRAVVRPEKISPSDRWTVKYQITRLDDAEARPSYTRCQNRRAQELSWDIETTKDNYFIQRIRQYSMDGRAWREAQDDLDAEREKVVLYGASLSNNQN